MAELLDRTLHTLEPETERQPADTADVAPRAPRRGLIHDPSTRALGLVAALIVLVLVILASISFGSKPIPLRSVYDALFQYNQTLNDHIIIRSLRVPRTIVGVLVGVALGLAGALMQGIARNPLADPGILGVEAGAALFVGSQSTSSA